jgi:hypothetical protein
MGPADVALLVERWPEVFAAARLKALSPQGFSKNALNLLSRRLTAAWTKE